MADNEILTEFLSITDYKTDFKKSFEKLQSTTAYKEAIQMMVSNDIGYYRAQETLKLIHLISLATAVTKK